MTGTASAAYVATANIIYSSNTVLSANVVNCIDLTIDTNVALTTNGYSIYCAGNFINYGTIVTGSDGTGGSAGLAGTSVPNSFGGSGGGGGASTAIAGENGGNTLVLGGAGGTITSENGNLGNSPAMPAVSNANIITWSGNFIGYLSSGGGGGGLSGSGVIGGNGVYGLYIQASNIIAGSIIANGVAGGSGALLSSAGAGGGGGAFILLSYGNGGYTAGTYNVLGGSGGAGATGYGYGGSGGNGNVVAYDYGTILPLDIITLPSISQSSSGNFDVGQSVTFSTSFIGGVSPYTYNWIVSNTVSGATVANSLYTSPLTSNSFTWTIPSSAAGNTVFANVIIVDSLSSSSLGSHTTVNSIESSTINVNPALSSLVLTPSTTQRLDAGQTLSFSAAWSGGTPDYTAALYSSTTPSCSSSSTFISQKSGLTSGAVIFNTITTVEGTLYYCFVVTDSATTPAISAPSEMTEVAVDPALTGVSLTVSNSIIDVGQHETIAYTWSGGTPNYSGNIIVSNAVATIANVLFTGVSGTSNTLSFTVPTGATGSYAVTANVFDSATTPTSNTLSNTLTVDTAPTATQVTPSTKTLDIGQNVIISTTLSGGTGPFTANLVYSSNGVVANSVTDITVGGTANLGFVPTYNGVFTFNIVITDTGTTAPYIFNAPGDSVINVNNALTGVSLTVSNSIVDVGQHETIAYTWSGGTPTYTGNIVVANSVGTLESVHFSGISTTSNTLSFTVPSGATGSYTVTANVFDSASTTVSNTLTNTLVANAIPTLIITPNTTTPVYGSSVKFTIEVLNGSGPTTVTLYNVTTSTRRSMGNVIVANSGATNTIIVSPAAISTFSFRANATDSANYVFNSTVSTITSHGSGSGGGGAGGGLPVGTTVITTTTVSPATTTIVPITTTVPGTAVSSPPAPPKNYTIVGTSYNITPSNQSRTITLPYNCSLPASRLAPYIYINGTWSKIASFTVNAAACTITFTVPPDPIVAIMESPAPAVPTTTAPPSVVTTVAPTTVVSPPVTPPSNAALLYAVIVIIIAVIIIVVVGLYLRRRH